MFMGLSVGSPNALSNAYSASAQVRFWRHRQGWLNDCDDYFFLGNAVLMLGKKLHGSAWNDCDPSVETISLLPEDLNVDTPNSELRRAVQTLRRHGRLKGSEGLSIFCPDSLPTVEQWLCARELIAEEAKTAEAAFSRSFDAIYALSEEFRSKRIKTAWRHTGGGEVKELDWHFWYTETNWCRFETCSFNPEQPFARCDEKTNVAKLLVERRAFEKFLNGDLPREDEPAKAAAVQAKTAYQRRGRPEQFDWSRIIGEVIRRIHIEGAPSSVRNFCRELADWCADNLDQYPDEGYLRQKVTPYLRPLMAEIS